MYDLSLTPLPAADREMLLAARMSFVFMHRATVLARSGHLLNVSLAGDRRVTAAAVILATGAAYRRLGVPALEALDQAAGRAARALLRQDVQGRGVSAPGAR